MFDSLARLANGRARRVGLFAIVFFLLAGALGGSVADRLDPYGAEDPDTETVKAMDRLEEAGLRVPAVIAVVEDAPVADPATRQRVVALEHQVRERPDVTSVTGYYDTRSPAFVSRDGRSTYFAVALKATGDKELQDIVKEGIEEHRQAKMFLRELSNLAEDSEKFEPKLKVLMEDIAIRNALGGVSAKEAEELSQSWRPWRSYAVMHLWRAA